MSTKEKQQKYDRQLSSSQLIRLWDNHGQDALEAAHVCVVNAGGLGCEILKNLILPGIGAFTIVDNAIVKESDLGNNFFLLPEHIGQSRAKSALGLLKEMNDAVQGAAVDESVSSILGSNPDFFKSFSTVIVTNETEDIVKQLAETLWALNIPLLSCRSYGMISYMRMVVQEHTIIETHPDDALPDLRIVNPFPALSEHVAAVDMDSLTLKEHSHVPYSVILLKELQRWQAANDGQIPFAYKDKKAFKDFIKQSVRSNESGMPEDELNFEEAVAAVNKTLVKPQLPSKIREIIEDKRCEQLNPETPKFWFMARALRDFIQDNDNLLPLRGSIPDMTADSDSYVSLQKIYIEKATEDRSAVMTRVQALLAAAGMSPDYVSEFDIKLFCKNAATLHVVRTRSFAEEMDPCTNTASELERALEDPDDSLVVLYILLRSADAFKRIHNHFPGEHDIQVDEDNIALKDIVANVVSDMGMSTSIKDDYIEEMVRYGAAEIHTVAAMLGGAAAHEVIKIVTHQYVPFNNTLIFNAVTNATATLQL